MEVVILTTLEKIVRSIDNNEFKDFLLGNGIYKIPNREGYYTDRSSVLYSGIYKYFELNSEIKQLFEKELFKLLDGDEFEILTAFDYVWDQIIAEEKKIAPFEMDLNVYLKLKKVINEKRDKLRLFRFYDFGENLEEGALQYINNINDFVSENYGKKIL